MSPIYSIQYIEGITVVSFNSKPNYQDTRDVIDDISENYSYKKRLWDLTGANFNFDMEEIKAISEYGKSKFIKENKIAVVAPNDLAFAEMRAFIVYREEEHTESMVFRTKLEAIDWLNK